MSRAARRARAAAERAESRKASKGASPSGHLSAEHLSRAEKLLRERVRTFGLPPAEDIAQLLLVSDGARVMLRHTGEFCSALRAEGDAKLASAIEAIQREPQAIRALIIDHEGRWRTARILPLTAPGGEA